MKVLALLPVLALLSGIDAKPSRQQHIRQVERIASNIEKKQLEHDMLEMQRRVEVDIPARQPVALAEKPRKVRSVQRRGAAGCRVRGQAYKATTTASTAAAATTTTASTAAATTATVAQYNNNNQQAAPATTTTSSSSTQAAAQPTDSGTSNGSSGGGSTSSGGSTNNGAKSGQLTPNGKKAGISAGDALGAMGSHIGWWYNWAPTDEGTSSSDAVFVSMLWGGGKADGTDSSRLSSFQSLLSTPTWIIGPEEPDCATGSGSAGMSIGDTAGLWNWLLAPKGAAGSLLLSPSMCHQMAEDGWLAQFETQISRNWDITNIHINKNNMDGVKADIDYYFNKYNQRPIWVTEFACVDDSTGFTPCTDQGEINGFINNIVDLFEADSRVYAYAYSNGYGLGNVWPMWSNGGLSQSGQTYLNAISKYH